MNTIQEIIKKIDTLEPISQVLQKLLELLNDTESSISDLCELILYDQALTANLLRICNSAYFGLAKRIDSINHAVSFLGMNQVADIVLIISASKNLQEKQAGYDLQENELWKYSVSSALIARELAEKKGDGNNHLIFTAALLKDIGKVILSQYVADSIDKINRLVTKEGFSFREAEQEVIGIDHAQLGGMVAEKWKFSPKMVAIIQNHHLPEESMKSDFETSIVYLADTLCMMIGIGGGADGLAYRFHSDVVDLLNFTEQDVQEVMAGFIQKLQKVEQLFHLN